MCLYQTNTGAWRNRNRTFVKQPPSISQHLVLGAQLSRSRRCGPKVPRFETSPHLVLSSNNSSDVSVCGEGHSKLERFAGTSNGMKRRTQFDALDDDFSGKHINQTSKHIELYRTIVSRGFHPAPPVTARSSEYMDLPT